MAKKAEKTEKEVKETIENKDKPVLTRAEKTDTAKKLIRALLEKSNFKSNELIDEGAKLYAQEFDSDEKPNSVKGRIGSVIDVMKKEGEIVSEGGTYALKMENKAEDKAAEKPKKSPKSKGKAAAETPVAVEETPKKKRALKKRKVEETEGAEVAANAEEMKETEETKKKEKATKATKAKKAKPLPAAPLQPIAPVAPVTPEIAPEPIPEETEKATPKKRGRKAKSETPVRAEESVAEEVAVQTKEAAEEVAPKKSEEGKTEVREERVENKQTVVDMSFLLGGVKTAKKELPKREEPKRIAQKAESLSGTGAKAEEKQAEKPQPMKSAQPPKTLKKERVTVRKPARALTADEKLKEAFLKKLRKLGGDYFEYYSVYLLEKYSRMNGRRLEGLKISGGDHDGGIDGEIELTDRLGFRETIYIQAKNWDPDKGDERLWVVGETLLQQFIGACVCRQAKDNKQHCRGIFITTSRFTAEAKKILEDTSDKFVGYDGNDLFDTAKECSFGLLKKNGEWAIDEELLSGEKAFFSMR